ncbi:MAG: hypothetical protein KDI51_19735, partial [Xanthomonadales bacterium]|nr:hypothetical protein [Xanthomonadales bacterium]
MITSLLLLALLMGRAQAPLGDYLLTNGQQSNCDGSDARPVRLPSYEPGQDCRRILLRRTLAVTEIHDQALLISGVGRDLRVWVNGKLLREFDPRTSFDGTSQLLGVSLQPGILREGENELLIHIRSTSHPLNRSYLGVLLLGPSELLWPTHQRIRRLGAQGAQLAVLFGLGILLTLLPMAWSRPQEPAYRWFALAVLGSLIYLWHMGWPLRPLPSMLWHWVAHAALLGALWAMLRYSIVQAGPAPRLRRWVNACTVFGVVAVLVKSVLDQGWLADLGDLLFRVDMIVLLILLAGFWWQRRQTDPLARWLVAAVLMNIVLGAADSVRVWSTLRGELAPYLLHWGILYLLVLLLVGQIRRILNALHTAEHAQSQLSQALAQRTLELQQEFRRRQQAEQAQTLAEERQRIMRDMHDGVGGQLVALIGQVEHGGLQPGHFRQQLRRSLDDLRLMIDSLDDACADLGVALGMLRQRLQASLQELPI